MRENNVFRDVAKYLGDIVRQCLSLLHFCDVHFRKAVLKPVTSKGVSSIRTGVSVIMQLFQLDKFVTTTPSITPYLTLHQYIVVGMETC